MIFWVIATGLTLAVTALLLMALLRERTTEVTSTSDIVVYRDQLAEIERDLARGVLTEDEAERTRIEVSRRLLEADRAAQALTNGKDAPERASLLGGIGLGLVTILGAAGIYMWLGAPGYPDLPLKGRLAMADTLRAERASQAEAEVDLPAFTPPPGADPKFLELMVKLRAAVAENPDELQGQQLLARNEAVMGNFRGSYPTQAAVIRLKGDAASAQDYATLGDLMVLAAGGYVSPEAEAAFNAALEMEPRNGPSRFYLGQMYAQNGRPDLTFQMWSALLAESSSAAPWVAPIEAQMPRVAHLAGERWEPRPQGLALSGPTREDVEAAQEMTAEERQDMIRGMVEGLAERLASEGGPAEEWARLIGALGVLGETERAAAIYAEAQGAFADEPGAMEMLYAAARRAGVAE